MKGLIKSKKRRFVTRTYDGRSYDQVLMEDFALTPLAAWDVLLGISIHYLRHDLRPSYYGCSDNNALIFDIPTPNGNTAYVKLKIEENGGEEIVCISFHLPR